LKKITHRILIAIAAISVFVLLGTINSAKTTPEAAIKAYYSDAEIIETIWITDDYPLCVFISTEVSTQNGEASLSVARFKSFEVFNTTYWRQGMIDLSRLESIRKNDQFHDNLYGTSNSSPISSHGIYRIDRDIYFMDGVTQKTGLELYRINGIEPTVIYTELDGETVAYWYVVCDSRLASSETTEIEYIGE